MDVRGEGGLALDLPVSGLAVEQAGQRKFDERDPTITIVMTNSADPVSAGLVGSLARKGGNVTGFSVDTGGEIIGKRLEFLKETLPNLSRVGILWNQDFASYQSRLTSMRKATQALGLTLVPVEARGLDALEQAFATMVKDCAQAFVVLGGALLFNYRGQIAANAVRDRLPAISTAREYAEAGLLLSYGPDLQDLWRRSAVFVDKIFKGAKPSDLPVEQPIKFELVVNLKTAKTLGVNWIGWVFAGMLTFELLMDSGAIPAFAERSGRTSIKVRSRCF